MTVDTSRLVRRHRPCLACWTCSNARSSSPVHAGPSRQSTGRAPFAAGPRTTTRSSPTHQRRFSSRGVCRPSRTGSAYVPPRALYRPCAALIRQRLGARGVSPRTPRATSGTWRTWKREASTGMCPWAGRDRRRGPATRRSIPRRVAWPRSCRRRRAGWRMQNASGSRRLPTATDRRASGSVAGQAAPQGRILLSASPSAEELPRRPTAELAPAQ